jgi:hypothetical protein
MTGMIVSRFGFNLGFVTLSAIAGLALAFYAVAMPETRPSVEGDRSPDSQLSPAVI